MAGLDDLSRGELQDILRRLRILETASPLQNASIGSNGLRVYDGGVITIENGGLNVTGTATIHGVLNADGTINFSGPVAISGPLTVSGATDITGDTTVTGDFTTNGPLHVNGTTDITGETTITGDTTVTGDLTTNGPLHVNGATDITGDLDVDGRLDINGAAMLNSDLTVAAGKKITVGDVSLSNISGGGRIDLGGSTIYSRASVGLSIISAGAGDITLTGTVQVPYHPLTSQPANVYIEPSSGKLYRSTA